VADAPAAPTALLRRRPLLLAGGALVVVAAVVLVVVLTSGGGRPVPPGTIPTLGNQFAAPTTSATPPGGRPADLPAYTGAPLWTFPLPSDVEEHDLPEVAVTDAGFTLVSREEVRGLDRAGKPLWRWAPPEVDYFTTTVTGPVVFVGYQHPTDDRWPQPEIVIALDSATGQELWREDQASLWSASTDAIYLSVCRGGQNTRIGDCTLSARDLRTNAVRWSVATYASARVEYLEQLQAPPTPPFLQVGAYPTNGSTYVVTTHDPATGRVLGRGWDSGSLRVTSPDTMLAVTDRDENPADGCQATVTGYGVTSPTQVWQQQAATPKTDEAKRCASLPESINNGRMALTTPAGNPAVLNVLTGAVEWTAPAPGVGMAASDTVLLAVADEELVAYRVGSAEPVWRAPFTQPPSDLAVAMTATTAVVYQQRYPANGYDLATGKAWTYGESVRQSTATWIAVCGETSCSGYRTR
jgi:hypothetical protein